MTDELIELRAFVERVTDFARSDDFERLIDSLRAKYLASWEQSRIEDVASREHLYRMVHAVEALKNEIASLANDQSVRAFNSRRALAKGNVIR